MIARLPKHAGNQSTRFLLLYALAAAGGSASYAPFLTLILPLRATELAGADAVQLLSTVAFVGAIAASLANIAFGWASDRTGNRRGWIVAGLFASSLLLLLMGQVRSIPHLLVLIVAWQVALNMMLNPLTALAGDCVPDHQKGTLGGLLSFAPGLGALVGAIVTIPGLADGQARLALIALIVMAMVLPVVLLGSPRPMPHLMQTAATPAAQPTTGEPPEPGHRSHEVWRMWLARLLVQVAESALFAFLLLWLLGLDARSSDNTVATLFTAVLILASPLAIVVGRWSDRAGRPMRPLVVTAFCGMVGLLAMAWSEDVLGGIAGYVVFGIAAGVFLALHSSQTLRVLPRPENRGRDLGFFNLTNTVPSLIMPSIALAMIPLFGFRALFLLLAALVGIAGLLLALGRAR